MTGRQWEETEEEEGVEGRESIRPALRGVFSVLSVAVSEEIRHCP